MTTTSLIPFGKGDRVALQVGDGQHAARKCITVVTNGPDTCICSDGQTYDRHTGKCLSSTRPYRAIHTPRYGEQDP